MGAPPASHYDVLGVDRRASAADIRLAYRALARQVHPDRVPAGGTSPASSPTMASINEAYRVLSDPGRRAMYDATHDPSLDDGHGYGSARPSEPDVDRADRPGPATRPTVLAPAGPARVPWKLMVVLAVLGSSVVLVSSFFDEPPAVEAPDGLLRLGSCIAFEPNGDAREVACTSTADDVVVELMVPLDATCPAGTRSHRDRQGMVMVCIPDQ